MYTVNSEQKIFALVAHLSYLLAGLGFIFVPLIIMLLRKEDYFVYEHAKQSLVSHLAILGVTMIVSFLTYFLIGFLFWPLVWVLWLVLVVSSVFASVRVINGESYRYPFIQWLVEKF